MTGHRTERLILYAWMLAVFLLGVFPPWASRSRAMGYRLIFLPPYGASEIDLARLVVGWIVVTVIAGGVWWMGQREA